MRSEKSASTANAVTVQKAFSHHTLAEIAVIHLRFNSSSVALLRRAASPRHAKSSQIRVFEFSIDSNADLIDAPI